MRQGSFDNTLNEKVHRVGHEDQSGPGGRQDDTHNVQRGKKMTDNPSITGRMDKHLQCILRGRWCKNTSCWLLCTRDEKIDNSTTTVGCLEKLEFSLEVKEQEN